MQLIYQDIIRLQVSVSDLFAVQVMQTNEDHCKVIQDFIIGEYCLFLHQDRKILPFYDVFTKIAPICKLSNDT
jgi:hypothetical protein